MENKIFIFIMLLTLSVLPSCTEDFDLRFDNKNGSVVIEGLITNEPGPYYVRVTRGSSSMSFPGANPNYYTSAIPITDAVVILSESGGIADTLVAPPDSIAKYYPLFDSNNNIIDSVLWGYETFPKGSHFGFYRTTKIQGTPGRTYHLSVTYQNQTFEAESLMPVVPEIDSIKFNKIVVKEADGTIGWVPILYFTDPINIKNYYLFDISTFNYGWWTYSILDDKYLDPLVQGVNIDDGFHPNWWEDNYVIGDSDFSMTVSIQSLTSEAFDYYNGLINQFNNDGGVFSPTPSSPESNFSNGALGFFRVSAKSKITGTYIHDPVE